MTFDEQPRIHDIDAAAVLWRDATDGRDGSRLLVVMHGLGSHEGDLFSLAGAIPPDMTVASLRAPLPHGGGWAWFASGSQESDDQRLIDASARGVLAWLDAQPDAWASVTPLGFSQGGAMSLQLARLAPERFDALVNLSGFVHDGEQSGDVALAERAPRMRAFHGHGTHDGVILASSVSRTESWMPEHLDVTSRRYPITHTISDDELRDVVGFLGADAR